MNNNSFRNLNQISPLEPIWLDFFVCFLIITFVLCVSCNLCLLITFLRFKDLRCSINYLIIAITISNLFGSLQFPFIIYSNYIRK